jgi:hypothetical protein
VTASAWYAYVVYAVVAWLAVAAIVAAAVWVGVRHEKRKMKFEAQGRRRLGDDH